MQKKCISIILMVTVFMFLVVGCGGGATSDEESIGHKEQLNMDKSTDDEKVEDSKADKEVLITVEELPYEITMLEPDSLGTRYMEATFTNNSNYIVTGYSLTVLLKDENEKTYLSVYDTVKPGETSPKFESFAPESGEEDDMEVLEYELTIQGEDGTEYFVYYDVKLDKYEVIEAVDD